MGKGFVKMSRYTPGLANAVDVRLSRGDKVSYRLLNGSTVTAEVHSDLMRHANGAYGYECTFHDNGQLGFADESRIIGWDGKVA